MKVYFNTKAFDGLAEKNSLDLTINTEEAELAVLGAKGINFSEFKNLKAIYRFGVGRENIPDKILQGDTPKVYFPSERTKEILYESTANFTVFLIFYMVYYVSIGEISEWQKVTRDSIRDKNLLVIGVGNIGKKVAEKMKPFMNVLTFDIQYNKYNELKPLMEASDIITLHIPLTDKTINFIDAEKMKWIKEDAIIINTARGALVNEDALYDKINRTKVRAAFDVFWEEPYNGKLKELGKTRFFMTPHSSSQTIEYVKAGFKDILNIINKYGGDK